MDPAHPHQRPATDDLAAPLLAVTMPQELAAVLPDGCLTGPADSIVGPTATDSGTLPSFPGYEVLRELGKGAMGVVYLARDTALKRLVAIKVVRDGPAAGPDGLARFRVEAETVARLQHPHVVQIYAWGESQGRPYFVLEYVTGGSLAERLKGASAPSPSESARLVMLLARAVHAAHQVGVVHRDLKPANVLLAPPADEPALNTFWGVPKVSDFGLARLSDSEIAAQTATGAVLGTPRYMAPEQADGHRAGPAADIWALGVIFYELLAGRPPFAGQGIFDILDQVRTLNPAPPRTLHPAVPEGIDAVCLKCLRKDPSDRYTSAADLAEDLRLALDGRMPKASVVGNDRHWFKRRIAFAAIGIVVLALGIGSAAFVAQRNGRGTDVTSPASSPITVLIRANIDLRVWRTGPDGEAARLRLTDLGALPLKPGDQFRIEATADRPAFLYLFWIDTEGTAVPVYPWQPGHWGTRPPMEQRVTEKELPSTSAKGYKINGDQPGMETIILVARAEQLTLTDQLIKSWFAGLPAQRPFQDAHSAVWFANGRIVTGEAGRTRSHFEETDIADPVLRVQALLKDRIGPHAAGTAAVSFARLGKGGMP